MAYNFKEQCEKSDLFLRKRGCIKLIIVKDTSSDTISEISDINIKTETDEDTSFVDDIGNSEEVAQNVQSEVVFVNEQHEDVDTVKTTNIKREHSYNSEEDFKPKRVKYKRKTGSFQCPKCDKVLTTRYGLDYHTKHHNEGDKYICPVDDCKRKFFWKPTLKRHMLVHSNEKQFLCYICGKEYSAADSFWYHVKRHEGKRPYLCTYCGKSYKQGIHLKYHMHSHTQKRPFKCSKCNRAYLGPTQLRRHWKKFCGIGKDPPPERRRRALELN